MPDTRAKMSPVTMFQRQLALSLWWDRWVRLNILGLFMWGVLFLCLRAAAAAPAIAPWPVFAGMLLLSLPAAFFVRRHLPDRDKLTGYLDACGTCGGLLIAGRNSQSADWPTEPPSPPGIRWRGARPVSLFLLAFTFALLVTCLPDTVVSPNKPGRLQVDTLVDELRQQLDTLVEQEIVEEDKATDYAEELNQLLEKNTVDKAGLTWEALDHLAETFSNEASEAAAETLRELAENAKTASAAETLARAAETMGSGQELSEEMEKALAEFTDYLKKNAETQAALEKIMKELAANGQEGLGTLTPEQLKQLAAAMSSLTAEELAKLGELKEMNLISAEQLQQCQNAGECGQEALAAWLKQEGGDCPAAAACLGGSPSDAAALMALQGMTPGTGGITRGPGHGAMAFSGNTDEAGAAFKDEVIKADRLDLEKSRLAGVSFAAPTADTEAAGSAGGTFTPSRDADAAAARQVILPRHRSTVENYFKRAE
ncbi:MAG: hypothetical protein RRC34_04780 [Lentisphaeria bacterium]|nr:hypothetical protein [Lentisphaeria bacterium]